MSQGSVWQPEQERVALDVVKVWAWLWKHALQQVVLAILSRGVPPGLRGHPVEYQRPSLALAANPLSDENPSEQPPELHWPPLAVVVYLVEVDRAPLPQERYRLLLVLAYACAGAVPGLRLLAPIPLAEG